MSDNTPDLDLIAMVQRARMQHDDTAQPSQIGAIYWIEAKRATAGAAPTARASFFSLNADLSAVDSIWHQIKIATEGGELGYKAKVSTASRGGRKDGVDREIRVQVADADDIAEVARIRAKLLSFGFSGTWRYVAHEADTP